MALPFIKVEKTREEIDLGKDGELSFEHVGLEKSMRHSNKDDI